MSPEGPQSQERLRTPFSRVAAVGDCGCRAATARACSSL